MGGDEAYRDVVIFGTAYLLLSLVPFLLLNREILDEVRDRLAALDVVILAASGTAVFVVISGLILAHEGIDRYNQFLLAPTDLLSVLVELAFLLAAVSWWAVPELLFRTGWVISLDIVLVGVLLCQLPMVVFLSLLTVIGKV
jgi:hypothetical protein